MPKFPPPPPLAGPKELLVATAIAGEEPAVGGHEADGSELVAGEPVPAGEDAHTSPQGEACDPHGRARAPGQEPAVRAERFIHVDHSGTRADDRLPAPGAHAHA